MPPIPAPIVNNAAAMLGSLVAGLARPIDLEAISDAADRMALIDPVTGDVEETPALPTFAEDDETEILDTTSFSDVEAAVQVKSLGGTNRMTVARIAAPGPSARARQALVDSYNQAVQQIHGRSALRRASTATDDNQSAEQNDGAYETASPQGKEAIRATEKNVRRVAHNNVVKNKIRGSRKADGSRTSLEYHEWKFNLIDTGLNWLLAHTNVLMTPYALSYLGSDSIGPNDAPPYYIWVQYEELRKIMNQVKKYRRVYTACGGKALWQAQGFASKDEAIADLLLNDVAYQGWIDFLNATSDFSKA